MPEIYDTTTSLQNFLQHNTPGGYFQTEFNISNDDLNNRIDSYLNGKNYLTSDSVINYKQIETVLNDNIKTVGHTGLYKDLERKPNFPHEYNEWLTPNSVMDPPTFHKVAFTGKYTDLDLSDIPGGNLPNFSTVTWNQITEKPILATYAPSEVTTFNGLFPLAKVAITGNYNDLSVKANIPSRVDQLEGYDTLVNTITGEMKSILISALNDSQIDIGNLVEMLNSTYIDYKPIVHDIDIRGTEFGNLSNNIFIVTSYLDENNQNLGTIKDVLDDIKNNYLVGGTFNDNPNFSQTIIRLRANPGTCILNEIEEYDGILKITFSPIDSNSEQQLQFIKNKRGLYGPTNPEEVTNILNSITGSFFYPVFYYDMENNTLIIKRDNQVGAGQIVKLAKTGEYSDIKNPPNINPYKEYDISTYSITNLRELRECKILGNNKIISNEQTTVKDWIEDIVNLYNSKIIKIKSNSGIMILNDVKQSIIYYKLTFSSLIEDNYNYNSELTDEENLNNINLENRITYFIYDKENDILWIKHKNF